MSADSPYPSAYPSAPSADPSGVDVALLPSSVDLHPHVVELEILRCSELPAADKNNLSDPYVTCESRTASGVVVKRFRTAIVRETLDPVFDKRFRFRARGAVALHFRVMDADAFGKDDLLGVCDMDLVDMADGEPRELAIPLRECFQSCDGRATAPVLHVAARVISRAQATAAGDVGMGFTGDSSDGEAGFISSCKQRV
jgi:Ca2+-dependent lipid-binding protein